MANYFPIMLTRDCRNWLAGLPKDSIDSWEKLCELFTGNYHGTWEMPESRRLLGQLRQRKSETLRDFIRRFFEKRNSIPFVDDHEAILAFTHGIANGSLINKWARKPPKSVNEMFQVANLWADGELAEKEQLKEINSRWDEDSKGKGRRDYDDRQHEEPRRQEGRGRKRRADEPGTVAAMGQGSGKITPEEFQHMFDM
ncbi:unnamed protein product [Urochloa humidicola]